MCSKSKTWDCPVFSCNFCDVINRLEDAQTDSKSKLSKEFYVFGSLNDILEFSHFELLSNKN